MTNKAIILFLILFLLMASCSIREPSGSSSSSTDFSNAIDNSTNLSDSNDYLEYGFSTKYFIEESSDNVISVGYPVFNNEENDKLNALVRNEVHRKIAEICYTGCALQDSNVMLSIGQNKEYSRFCINIDYHVTYESKKLISIVFDGISMQKSAAHPIHQFFTINVDPMTCRQIKFSDKYIVNEDLYRAFAEKAKEYFENTSLADVSCFDEICSKESFINGMHDEKEFYSYYTDLGVGFSYPVVFALGNHLETEIPNEIMIEFEITQET